jgi:lysozyme
MTHGEFFEWLKSKQDNNRLTQEMVDGANELLGYMLPADLQQSLSKINKWQVNAKGMALSENGSNMIKRYEKFMSNPYRDAVGVWTIGYGNTYYENRQPIRVGDKAINELRASELKQNIINMDFAPAVNKLFADEIASGKLNQNQFDALVSLAYNIGTRGLAGSSVARYIKQGDMKRAADSFLAWNKGRINGKLTVLRGLTRRRNEERDLFLA